MAFESGFLTGEADPEEDERNKKQAQRNKRIRGLLGKRRASAACKDPSVRPEARSAAAEAEPLSGDPPWFFAREHESVNLRLHEELLDFTAFIRPTERELRARRRWVAQLDGAARSLWPACAVEVFGSSSTGLCLPSADVDVALCNVADRQTTAMKRLAERLLERKVVSEVKLVQSARVPVLKLVERQTGLRADVIVNRRDGVEASKFLREQIELFPALVPVTLLLKCFLAQRRLGETLGGGMGSFLLVCLVLSFLQRHPSATSAHAFANTTLANLVFDFFRHYGQEFRYQAMGISVVNGGSLFDRVERGWVGTTRSGGFTLSLESPVDTSVDIGAGCFKMGTVRAAFNQAYHALGDLFMTQAAPGQSLLCAAGLVSSSHPLIAQRASTLCEQSAALLESVGVAEDASDAEEMASENESPAAKSARRSLHLEGDAEQENAPDEGEASEEQPRSEGDLELPVNDDGAGREVAEASESEHDPEDLGFIAF